MVEEIQLTVVEKLFKVPKSEFSQETRTRLMLPVRHGGGMGLTASAALMSSARVASYRASEAFL